MKFLNHLVNLTVSANYNVLKILHKDVTMTNTQKMVRLNLDLSPELNQILDELAKK